MVLTKQELIGALQNEVRIFLHLAGKIDPAQLDYRLTPKQRSTIELLRYMSVMGPMLLKSIKAGAFNREGFQAASAHAATLNFDQLLGAIDKQRAAYAEILGSCSDEDFRGEIDLFGAGKATRGSVIAHLVLGGCAAYRMQLFLHLKAGGRDELNTMNLWSGVDAPMPG